MYLKMFLVLISLANFLHAMLLNNGEDIPQFDHPCRRTQPDLDDCIKNSLQLIIQRISEEGIPKFNVPPVDPAHKKEFNINSANEALKFGLTLKDNTCYGISHVQILNVRSSLKNPEEIILEIGFFIKSLDFDGKFSAQGLTSGLPIITKGLYISNNTDISATVKAVGHITEVDGKEYLRMDHIKIRSLIIGDMKVELLNNDARYSDLNNLFEGLINQYWRTVFQQGLPYFQRVADKYVTENLNRYITQIPYNSLIPEQNTHTLTATFADHTELLSLCIDGNAASNI